MIWFISYDWFDMVYHTSYFCTMRWSYIDIAISSLTTNYYPFKRLIMLSPTISTQLLSFLFLTDWLLLHVLAAVGSLEVNILLFIPLLLSCRWFFLDISSCWILPFLSLLFVSTVTENVLISDCRSCFSELAWSFDFASFLGIVHNLYENQWHHLCQKHDQMNITL